MRTRFIHRLIMPMIRNILDFFSSSTSYSPLSPQKSTACCASLKTRADPNNSSQRSLSFIRYLIGDHLAVIISLYLIALRLFFHTGVISYVLSAIITCFLLIRLAHVLEYSSVFAPNAPDRARFLVDLPAGDQFPCWKFVNLNPTTAVGTVTLKCVLILQENLELRSSAPTIIFFHGNAGNIGHRLPLCKLLYEKCKANIFLLEYRGFGYSTGFPCELGFYADAFAAVKFLTSNCDEIDSTNVFLYGRSLGGAIVIDLMTRLEIATKIQGAIIENTFSSICDMGNILGSNIFGSGSKYLLPDFIISNKFQSLQKLRSNIANNTDDFCCSKCLFLSGAKDELVPPAMMKKLASSWASFSSTDQSGIASAIGSRDADSSSLTFDPDSFLQRGNMGLVIFPEGDHETTWLCSSYFDVINRFISISSSENINSNKI